MPLTTLKRLLREDGISVDDATLDVTCHFVSEFRILDSGLALALTLALGAEQAEVSD
jgi:hypothetical protein